MSSRRDWLKGGLGAGMLLVLTNLLPNVGHAEGAQLIVANASGGDGELVPTVPGTAQRLRDVTTLCQEVIIQAKRSNKGFVRVGLSEQPRLELAPTASIALRIDDLRKVFVSAATNGDGVSFTYLV